MKSIPSAQPAWATAENSEKLLRAFVDPVEQTAITFLNILLEVSEQHESGPYAERIKERASELNLPLKYFGNMEDFYDLFKCITSFNDPLSYREELEIKSGNKQPKAQRVEYGLFETIFHRSPRKKPTKNPNRPLSLIEKCNICEAIVQHSFNAARELSNPTISVPYRAPFQIADEFKIPDIGMAAWAELMQYLETIKQQAPLMPIPKRIQLTKSPSPWS